MKDTVEKVIDIGIVNYNGGDYLSKCVKSITEIEGILCNIYILDNASTDQSIEAVENTYPQCVIIRSEKNLGYAGGCNLLIQHFKSDIVALCNMDLEFSPDWGMKIFECFQKNTDAASVGSMVIERDTGKVYSSGVFFYWDFYPLSSNEKPLSDDYYEVFGSYGAVMVFKRDVFEKIGLFDNDYFLFFEETEFYWRLNINQLKTIFNPQAKVYHHRSVSTIKYSPLKLFYSERNRIWTAFKYLPLWYFPFIFPLSIYRLYIMSKRGVPSSDGSGKSIRPLTVITVLLKAWILAFFNFGREWRKRVAMWKNTGLTTIDTLKIIRKYKLPTSELRIK